MFQPFARLGVAVLITIAGLALLACSSDDDGDSGGAAAAADDSVSAGADDERTIYLLRQTFPQTVMVTTTSLTKFGLIDQKHTCEGQNISMQLSWQDVPEGAQSFTLVFEDLDGPDGDPWTHWILYNIPPDATDIAESAANEGTLPAGSLLGKNDNANIEYSGPCPPPLILAAGGANDPNFKTEDSPKEGYYLRLYALDTVLDLDEGASRNTVLRAIEGHVIAGGEVAPEYRTRKRVRGTCNQPGC